MIGIDTNVLLRAMLDDDDLQSPAARRFLSSLTPERPGYIGLPVALELFWVLRSRVGLPRREIVASMFDLFAIESLIFEDSEVLIRSLRTLDLGGVDFSDAVIAERNASAGCEKTVTFDNKAARGLASMERLA